MLKFLFLSLEDFDVEEEDEEALIEQRRIQRQAIVQVGDVSMTSVRPQCHCLSKNNVLLYQRSDCIVTVDQPFTRTVCIQLALRLDRCLR